LAKRDGKLSGICESKRGDDSAQAMAIEYPELQGNKLTFDITREFNDRSFTVTYQGIVDGDQIKGWTMMEFNGTPRDFEWTAKR
jgi:hypothetical protein